MGAMSKLTGPKYGVLRCVVDIIFVYIFARHTYFLEFYAVYKRQNLVQGSLFKVEFLYDNCEFYLGTMYFESKQ